MNDNDKKADKQRRLNIVRVPNPLTEITFLKRWGQSDPGTRAKPPKSIADCLIKAQIARAGWNDPAPVVAAPAPVKAEEKPGQTPSLSLPKPKGK
jgi:hypothetical protein